MNEITLLAKSGLGWQGIGGIILLLTGVGLIYFGIKALQGYRFFPEQEYNIPEEDHYEPTQAKALQKIKTTMPDFNGGEDRVFTEWKIGYTVDGEKYTQIVTDNGYEKGDMIDIKGSRGKRGENAFRLCGYRYRCPAWRFRCRYAYR